MQKILRDPGSLRFPVTPDSHSAVVDMISSHYNINCGMHLYSRYLGSSKLHHIVDVMNMIVLDNAEHSAHTAYDSALLAVMNIVSSDYVTADLFF